MVVIRSLPLPKDDVWYLAYGSNLSSSKFVKDRGIVPLESAIVSVAGFTLAMESAGVPYNEPSFASIRPLDMAADPKERGLLGTAYLVTAEQYRHIIESEGGGIAYREVEVAADAIETNASDSTATEHIVARTLVTVLMRRPAPRPSLRYLVSYPFQHSLLYTIAGGTHFMPKFTRLRTSSPAGPMNPPIRKTTNNT